MGVNDVLFKNIDIKSYLIVCFVRWVLLVQGYLSRVLFIFVFVITMMYVVFPLSNTGSSYTDGSVNTRILRFQWQMTFHRYFIPNPFQYFPYYILFFIFLWVGCNHWKITEKFTTRLIFHILRTYFARWTRMVCHRFEVYEIHRKSTILFTCALKSKFILCSRVTRYSEMNKFKMFSNLF